MLISIPKACLPAGQGLNMNSPALNAGLQINIPVNPDKG